MSKKKWFLIFALLLATNAASWNRERITKLFESERPNGNVNIGILIHDELLSGNHAQDVAFARSHLSESYRFVFINKGKVPLPMSPFTEGTGFHFQPSSRSLSEPMVMR